ncbi:MAG: DUF5610 domain-containing protein [Magnetococcales bacterium]|nr:DUF5610 domain-containing protein [Magnetococcales bacterium]
MLTVHQQSSAMLDLYRTPEGTKGISAMRRSTMVKETDGDMTRIYMEDVVSVTAFVDIERANETMIDKIVAQLNAHLEESEGFQPIEDLNPADHTPEKTAEFIVASATGFFSAYTENHSDEESQAVLDGFVGLIRGAINEGFRQARSILQGMDVLNGSIKGGVDLTQRLVNEGLDKFYQDQIAMFQDVTDSDMAEVDDAA